MRSLFGELREHILGKGIKIVFPEGNDDRVVRAAARLKFKDWLILLFWETQQRFTKSCTISVLQTLTIQLLILKPMKISRK